MEGSTGVSRVISNNFEAVLDAWIEAQSKTRTGKLMTTEELRSQCAAVLRGLEGLKSYDLSDPAAAKVRDELVNFSQSRGLQGFTPIETATFVFSMKDAILPFLKTDIKDIVKLSDETMAFNQLIDNLGMVTFASYVESRENYIREQQKSILELSTPVVEVWENILMLPIIGSVDTARTQQMMESLLNKIVDTESTVVIVDITGVPIVDTAVAKHLLQTITAARLLGAQCILVGISARIAQTLVHIGVDLSDVITGTTLARGLELALSMTNRKIVEMD